MKNIKTYFSPEFIRYVIIGISAYAIELGILIAFTKIGLSATKSTAISFWIGLIVAFILQKFIAFNDSSRDIKRLGSQSLVYLLLVVFNYLFTLSIVASFGDNLVLFSRSLAIFITTFWNFYIYRRLFKKTQQGKKPPSRLPFGKYMFLKFKENWLTIFIPLAFISLFFWQYISTRSRLIGGDFDYIAQLYESFRVSVIKYGQFPSWNPWMSGGIPLYTNPQFGLISIQSIFVLLFGTIVGLKLAYVAYAFLGYIGFYLLLRFMKVDKFRSVLIGLIWVFSGFFAGHSIAHFTFASFYLFPWILLFLAAWEKKFAWVGLGVFLSIITLSSLHYAFLMISFSLFILALVFYILQFFCKKSKLEIKKFIYFLIKSFILFLTLSWYRILTTYQFINSNPRPSSLLAESPVNPFVLLQALFLPIGTLLKIPSDLQWGWGEYSAYMGFGVTICLGIILISIIRNYKKNSKIICINKPVVFAVILLGLASMLLALGDFFKLSPYNILREIPGFSQTRVSSRWLVFASFSVLTAIAFWKKNRLAINIFLILAILELFISFGPIFRSGAGQVSVPITTRRNSVIVQYEKREMKRGEVEKNLEYSYFYSTQRNIGQLYSDDSIVNTLNGVVGTKRCGQNIKPSCDLILSDNADVYYWSPNRIVLRRTSGNLIDINMNPDPGWRVNNAYPFSSLKGVNPEGKFTIGNANADYYELEYAPKLSPNWFIWKIFQIF